MYGGSVPGCLKIMYGFFTSVILLLLSSMLGNNNFFSVHVEYGNEQDSVSTPALPIWKLSKLREGGRVWCDHGGKIILLILFLRGGTCSSTHW
jgi:hypothetical protein